MTKQDDSKQLLELVRRFERKIEMMEEVAFSCCNITIAQSNALLEIGRNVNISLNDLSKLLNLENSTMSRTVNNLVNNQLVKREIDSLDRRYISISLTEKGYKLYKIIEDNISKYFDKVYQDIPENKRMQVLESLEVLLSVIDVNECCK
ncbi:MarR family winged helix-turn-helix transcriptional regulator [Sedimentibacter sp.]|uniref:MarR family winged helix-turn-helix transcriptional regulator n=1 Tax=Sedimentibacter sp. TaxID=1960295 RepID=UPI00289999CC|nr:MarR family winged helix-turn-helix transcriptional regulator [Sedimentibacter sp.]